MSATIFHPKVSEGELFYVKHKLHTKIEQNIKIRKKFKQNNIKI
jgi:hypothetical protein